MEAARAGTDRKKTFEVFPDREGRWCARRIDGLVFGLFVSREAALRFVRFEGVRLEP